MENIVFSNRKGVKEDYVRAKELFIAKISLEFTAPSEWLEKWRRALIPESRINQLNTLIVKFWLSFVQVGKKQERNTQYLFFYIQFSC